MFHTLRKKLQILIRDMFQTLRKKLKILIRDMFQTLRKKIKILIRDMFQTLRKKIENSNTRYVSEILTKKGQQKRAEALNCCPMPKLKPEPT